MRIKGKYDGLLRATEPKYIENVTSKHKNDIRKKKRNKKTLIPKKLYFKYNSESALGLHGYT